MPRAAVVALACVVSLVWPVLGRAEESRRILVMLEQTKPAFVSRLRAELASLGFGVTVGTPSNFPPGRSEIEQLAQAERATAGLLLIEAGGGVEFWVIDPAIGRTTFREVILGFYDPREAPEVVAIRVVETLRATLKDVQPMRQNAPDPAARVAPEIASPPSAAPARFTLGVGGGGAYSSGGLGPMAHLDLSLAWALSSRFSVAVDGALTPARTALRGSEGEANAAWYLAGVSLRFSATDPNAPVRLRSGIGAWLSVMSLSGQPVTPYVSTPSQFVSVIPHLDLGLRFALTAKLGLAVGLSGGVSAPSASIHFAERQVATWGKPVWLGSLALEAPLD